MNRFFERVDDAPEARTPTDQLPTTTLYYNALGQVVSTTTTQTEANATLDNPKAPSTTVTKHYYNALGQTVCIIDPNGNTTWPEPQTSSTTPTLNGSR